MQETEDFKAKKRKFFLELASQTKEMLKMHEKYGLWEKDENNKSWSNVSEHCLAEAARVGVFADLLKLAKETKDSLQKAAALHDFFKKNERKITLEKGDAWKNIKKAEKMADKAVKKMNLSPEIAGLFGAIGSESFGKADLILKKKAEDITEKEMAFLVMHYVDDYTIGDEWVKPVITDENGNRKNDLDRRVDKNSERYKEVNNNPKVAINGENILDAERRIGHLIEKRLARLIKEKSGIIIEPIDLPEFIDKKLLEKINSLNQ